ncbi:hypothetical protein EOD42_11535 [Rhodovarius crocodyli]|uniref:Glycine zipper family protein n=1 Tax=Rhodovarius crocodyli TaxID=1979269 RepID=A0A437MH86_9PROT|nr:hypothetical protein [Rhodovarius crocodyli]RVT97018.1 hypothetical protein EOD42_11535 [Rhodovarius crocodyli]
MRPVTRLAAVAAVLLPAACAAPPPPSGPSIVALPQSGSDLARFQREDIGCRGTASAAISASAPAPGTQINPVAPPPAQSPYAMQRNYDIAYAQCMTAAGHQIQQRPTAYGYGYGYAPPVVVQPAPVYGGWWGVGVGFGPRYIW